MSSSQPDSDDDGFRKKIAPKRLIINAAVALIFVGYVVFVAKVGNTTKKVRPEDVQKVMESASWQRVGDGGDVNSSPWTIELPSGAPKLTTLDAEIEGVAYKRWYWEARPGDGVYFTFEVRSRADNAKVSDGSPAALIRLRDQVVATSGGQLTKSQAGIYENLSSLDYVITTSDEKKGDKYVTGRVVLSDTRTFNLAVYTSIENPPALDRFFRSLESKKQ